MGTVSAADLTQLESIANHVSALQPTIAALGNGAGITGTADCRWGRTAAQAYAGFDTAAKAATKSLATLMPEQAAVIHQYVRQERAIQESTKEKSEKLGEAVEQMPQVEPSKPKTVAGGTVNPDGTISL